jgi:hypothetical protein
MVTPMAEERPSMLCHTAGNWSGGLGGCYVANNIGAPTLGIAYVAQDGRQFTLLNGSGSGDKPLIAETVISSRWYVRLAHKVAGLWRRIWT